MCHEICYHKRLVEIASGTSRQFDGYLMAMCVPFSGGLFIADIALLLTILSMVLH